MRALGFAGPPAPLFIGKYQRGPGSTLLLLSSTVRGPLANAGTGPAVLRTLRHPN